VILDKTFQLNFGGNTDFLNMLERDRLESKKISKTNAVTSQLPYKLNEDNVHVGPKRLRSVADRPQVGATSAWRAPPSATSAQLELKLEVWDSPNSAGVVIDAVRCAKIALDRDSKADHRPGFVLHEDPPVQYTDDKARQLTRTSSRENSHAADRRFIGEPIQVEFTGQPALSKKAGCPAAFTWRGSASP